MVKKALSKRGETGMTAPTRVTDAPFSPAEAEGIRRMVKLTGLPGQCPRCASPLAGNATYPAWGRNLKIVRMLRCPTCRRMLTL
jgi:hypothetical protein